jgi:hypothetical protein
LEQETPVSASANSLYVDLYYDERRYLVWKKLNMQLYRVLWYYLRYVFLARA